MSPEPKTREKITAITINSWKKITLVSVETNSIHKSLYNCKTQ